MCIRAQGPSAPRAPRGAGTPGGAPLTKIEGFNKESLLRNSSGLITVIRTFVLNISMLSTELDLLKSQKLNERLDLYVEKFSALILTV